MMKRLAGALSLVLMLGAANAGPAGTPLLSADAIDASHLLPPPPAVGSAEALGEITELRAIAAARSPAELATAIRDADDETGDTFADAIGPGFDLAKLPATAKLLADIGATEDLVSKPAKKFFHRDRPWTVIPSWSTCTPHKDGPAQNSYPSGHATIAFAMGVVLASLMPQKAQAILKSSTVFAESRLVCGVHFRSDTVAGQAFGTAIALDLWQSPAFKAEYDAAATELRAAHLTGSN